MGQIYIFRYFNFSLFFFHNRNSAAKETFLVTNVVARTITLNALALHLYCIYKFDQHVLLSVKPIYSFHHA